MNRKNKNLILSILAVLTVILITGGVTYAFFNYAKEGTTDNVITTGSITFLYTEVDGVGNGIQIENAFPISDEVGKKLSKTNEYFDFKITSETTSSTAIPYEVTARKSSNSDDIDEYVRVYLTKGTTNEEVLLDNYSNLTQTSKVSSDKYIEKTIYTGKVPANQTDYEETFRLRMWIDENTRFDSVDMNNKTFTLTVNVYANAKVVTEEEIALENSAKINVLSINNTELTAVEGQDYDYETTLPEGTTSTTINIETESPDATVKVEKIDNLAKSNNIKRLAVSKTLELTNGENLFKVTVMSENRKIENEYRIKINVQQAATAFKDAILKKYEVIETIPTLTTTSEESNENGLYKSTLTNSGNPTYYFRGNVNNTVEFAGQSWKVVRINEDDTIRLILAKGINNDTKYVFNSNDTGYTQMYYSVSMAKTRLEAWYQTNIVEKGYSTNVVTGDYFCEEAKVKNGSDYVSGSAVMAYYKDYTPTFKCNIDGNNKGVVNADIGLITYDEVVYAGGYSGIINNSYYLCPKENSTYLTMSPAGVANSTTSKNEARVWSIGGIISSIGSLNSNDITYANILRPVINLKADTPVVEGSDTVWKVVE